MCSLFFQAILEMGWRDLGAFGGSNPTLWSMPTSSTRSLYGGVVCSHARMPYVCLAPLLQTNPVLPHSVLISIVPGYYQQSFLGWLHSRLLVFETYTHTHTPYFLGIESSRGFHFGLLFTGPVESGLKSLYFPIPAMI